MTIFCPYCRNTRPVSVIGYRCHADYGCEAVPGVRFARPQRCTNGHDIVDRVCSCGERLPTGYVEHGGTVVAIVGAAGSGKTTFLTVLVRVMVAVAPDQLGAAFDAADDDSDRRYKELKDQLYGRGQALPGTQPETRHSPRRPLIFKLEWSGPRKRRQTIFLVFYDTAGDDLHDEAHAQHVAPYLRAARGLIMLVDPSHLDAGADLAGDLVADRPGRWTGPREVLEYATRPLSPGGRGRGRRGRHKVPLAVTLTKVDALAENLARQSAIHRPGRPGDPGDRRAVHEQVRSLLHRWNSGLERPLSLNYSTVGYFGLSPLGAPLDGGVVDSGGIRPNRVTDPLLWILDSIGALPAQAMADG